MIGCSKGVADFAVAMPGYSHNDIKSPNFLVHKPDYNYTFQYIVKLCDVEFASNGETPAHLSRGDTPMWTAPEVLSNMSPVSPASDVYSLATVLCEILTRRPPFDQDTAAISSLKIQHGERPSLSATTDIQDRTSTLEACLESRGKVIKLIESAWSHDPVSRPSAQSVYESLDRIRSEYLNLQNSESKKKENGTRQFQSQGAILRSASSVLKSVIGEGSPV
jgi:serine/threonine protein kinase